MPPVVLSQVGMLQPGLFPSHQPELILIQTHKAGPSAPIARRRNEDKCGCQRLPASLFLIYLELGRRDGRRETDSSNVTDGILSSSWDKVRESTIKRKHRLHVKACVHGLCARTSVPRPARQAQGAGLGLQLA